jgi:flagellar hook assembly protein FlgD
LLQNYPNPFNPSTTIKIEIPESSHVKLEIYNIEGQEIITLADSHYRAGIYEILWNGRDKNNLQVVSGMYFCRVSSDEHIISNKMLLLK